MTKKRQANRKNSHEPSKQIETNHLRLREIKPLTSNQRRIFDTFASDQHVFLHGFPGTGKTFLAIERSLSMIGSGLSEYERLVVVRSAVQSRDIGFLPGRTSEKMKEFETPYIVMVNELFGRDDAYSVLKNKSIIEIISTSFLRGTTINNAIMLVDECQNLNFGELETALTRSGANCRVVFCGDVNQDDLRYKRHETSGLADFMRIVRTMDSFDFIEMTIDDVVRSGLVKEYLLAKHGLTKRRMNGFDHDERTAIQGAA